MTGISGNDDWRSVAYGHDRRRLLAHLRTDHPHIDLTAADQTDLSIIGGWHDADHQYAGEPTHTP